MDNPPGDDSRGTSVFIVTIIIFVLATLFVLARVVSRFLVLKRRSLDDWVMIIAWFIAFGLSFSIIYATRKGLGRDDSDIPDSWRLPLNTLAYVATILYFPALMASKSSVLIFYLRLASNTQGFLRRGSYVTLAVVNVGGLLLLLLTAFQCNAVKAAFVPGIRAKCLSIATVYLCSVPLNLGTDLAILVLPIPVLTKMHIPRRQKFIIVFLFSLCIFVTIVDVIRIYYLQGVIILEKTNPSGLRISNSPNFAHDASLFLMWSTVEVNMVIVCACIPTLRPLSGFGSQHRSDPDLLHHRPSATVDFESGTQPIRHAEVSGEHEGETTMMDFITTPYMDQAARDYRIARSRTTSTRETGRYFGFIDVKRPKSMLKATSKESLRYCLLVSILFFLWGFSYGIMESLAANVTDLRHATFVVHVGLSSAYFGGYFFGPLTLGQWVLRHWGFKATFICGLSVYGIATVMFWAPAVLASFVGLAISQFVAGFGLSTIETAANPFIALCGPPQYAEFRLLLAQVAHGSSGVLSHVLSTRVFFPAIIQHRLIKAQWTYLAIALFTVALGLVFYHAPLPEATDEDLQSLSERLPIPPAQPLFSTKLRMIYVTGALAIFAQFSFVAAQQGMAVWQVNLLNAVSPPDILTINPDDYGLISEAAFTISRFIFALLCLVVRPRLLLLISFIGSTIFAALTASLHLDANAIAALVTMTWFFLAPIWPLVFAIGLRGMGRWTKYMAAGITASASSGVVFPFVMWAIADTDPTRTQHSFVVVIAAFAFGTIFPAYLYLVPKAGRQIDPVSPDIEETESHSPFRRLSRTFSVLYSKISGNSSGNGSGRRDSELPTRTNGNGEARHQESSE